MPNNRYTFDFVDGVQDCRNGNPAPTDASDAYMDGYSAEKFKEESDTAKNIEQESQ